MAEGIYQADFLAADVPANLRPAAARDGDSVTLTACCFCGQPFVAARYLAVRPFTGSGKHLIAQRKCFTRREEQHRRLTPFGGHNYRANEIHKGQFRSWLQQKAVAPEWPAGLLDRAGKTRKGQVTFRYH